MNSITAIKPYQESDGVWRFDDSRTELRGEAFVAGIDDMIDEMVRRNGITNAQEGFTLLFSPGPFPGCDLHLEWVREEHGGNWYHSNTLNITGWLCPALFKYFETAPANLYAQFKQLPSVAV